MKTSKILSILLIAVLCLSMLASCGGKKDDSGSGSSASDEKAAVETEEKKEDKAEDKKKDEKSSLEAYFKAHPKDLQDIKDGVNESEEAQAMLKQFDVDIYAKGNTLYYDYTFKQQLEQDQIDKLKEPLEQSFDSLEGSMSTMISSVKDNLGIPGSHMHVVYRNNDGEILGEREYTK